MDNIMNYISNTGISTIVEKIPTHMLELVLDEVYKDKQVKFPKNNRNYLVNWVKDLCKDEHRQSFVTNEVCRHLNGYEFEFSEWDFIPGELYSASQWDENFDRKLTKDARPICHKLSKNRRKSNPLYDESQTEPIK